MLESIIDEIPFPAAVMHLSAGQPVTVAYANRPFHQTGSRITDTLQQSGFSDIWQLLLEKSKQNTETPAIWTGKLLLDNNQHEQTELVAEIKYLENKPPDTSVFLVILRRSEAANSIKKYQTLVEQSKDLCVLLTQTGHYLYVSPMFSTDIGYTAEEIMGANAFDFVHPDDLAITQSAFNRLQTELSVQAPPYRFKKKDGNWCWLQSVGTMVGELDGTKYIVVNNIDITALILAQQNLNESNERYQLIYKTSKDALYDWDILTDTFYWGEGFSLLFGHFPTESGFHLADRTRLTHPADIRKNQQRWLHFLADTSQSTWTNEARFRRADGQYVYVEETGYLIRDVKGRPVRMIGSLRDVNDSKLNQLKQLVEDEINWLFKKEEPLADTLQNVVNHLSSFSSFDLAAIWMIGTNHEYINQVAFQSNSDAAKQAYLIAAPSTSLKLGEGIAGNVWQTGKTVQWSQEKLLAGLPILHNNTIIGALVIGSTLPLQEEAFNLHILEALQATLGADIKRKQQEEEMRLVFESAPDILAIISPDGYFTKVNPAFCNLMGYTAKELTSHPFHYFIHADDLSATEQEFLETVNGDRNANSFVNRYVTKTGEHRWISWSSSDAFGEENLAFAYGRDITEMKELEELIDNTSKLARVGSWEINMADKFIFCSKITRQILELKDGQQLRLNNKLEFVKASSKHIIRTLLQAAIFDKKPWDIEVEIRTAKAGSRWVRLIGQASFNQGRCARIYGSIQDIHDKKLVQLQLEEANDRFERVSSATNDAIWDWDLTKMRLTWNDGFRKIFGYTTVLEGTPATDWKDMVHPDDLLHLSNAISRACSDPIQHLFEAEFRFLKKDGSYAYVSDKGTIIRNHRGVAIRMVGAMTDISHRKAYEASLQNLNNELKRINHELAGSNAELEQFAFVASHDLQEPLRMITGFLTMLEKKYGPQLDDKANQYIYFAVDGAKRMRGIILDLLEYSRVGRMNTTHELVDCNQIVADIEQLLKSQLEERSARLTLQPLPTLLTFKLPLQQVLQNLISNALKYSRPEVAPHIHISCQEHPQYWEFAVKDNGIGIAPEYQEKIFIIFQRLHYTPDIPGTGMGLAIAKKIIDWQGGKIWVESIVGEGSTFYFTLPK